MAYNKRLEESESNRQNVIATAPHKNQEVYPPNRPQEDWQTSTAGQNRLPN